MFNFFQRFQNFQKAQRQQLLQSQSPQLVQPIQRIESTHQLQLGDNAVVFTLRKSPKARNLRLSISPERGLLVTTPLRCSEKRALQFVEQNVTWIAKQLAKQSQKPNYKFNFLDGTAKYLGEDCQIVVSIGLRDYASLADGKFSLNVRQREEKNCRRALTGFYKREARKLFEQRVAIHAAALNVAAQRIAIRGQTTKWGSCSHRGNLNFNWKLAMAPLHVIDYLVIHELSHLKHFNHSKQFWATVEQFCPGYNLCEEWLKQNSALLSF